MLTLERGRGRSIYSLGGRRGTWPSALHCSHTGGAGCPGVGPDVRGFRRRRMSGSRRRMSGLEVQVSVVPGARRWISGALAGFPGWGRISGASWEAGCPGPGGRMSGPCSLRGWAAAAVLASPGAGCPGSGPNVRGLEGELVHFGWFSSSVEWAACPSSHASSGGSS